MEPLFAVIWRGSGEQGNPETGNYFQIWNPENTWVQQLSGMTAAELWADPQFCFNGPPREKRRGNSVDMNQNDPANVGTTRQE